MISRKRIAELIEQEGGCYVLDDYQIGYVHLKLKYEPELYVNGKDGYILYIYCNDKKDYKEEIFDEDLFETEEEAEWHKEFSCIERTERLELPTWEEINLIPNTRSFCIFCAYNSYYDEYCKYILDRDIENDQFIIISHEFGEKAGDVIWAKKFTKENYLIACRKCKELFLGKDS